VRNQREERKRERERGRRRAEDEGGKKAKQSKMGRGRWGREQPDNLRPIEWDRQAHRGEGNERGNGRGDGMGEGRNETISAVSLDD